MNCIIKILSAKKYVKKVNCLGARIQFVEIEIKGKVKFEGINHKGIIYLPAFAIEQWLNKQ